MSDQETPQDNAPPSEESAAPAASPPATEESPGEVSSNRNLMIVLSYLWILFLVPLLFDKDDKVVQWHAKHGFVLSLTEIGVYLLLYFITLMGVGCVSCVVMPFVFLAFAVLIVVCIIKGINGEKFMIPGISQFADKF